MRLFIAINLPDEVREEIWITAAPLRERPYAIKWVDPDAIHITLKFLGEVSAHREKSLSDALDAAVSGVSPFTLPLGGFGAFPDTRRANVIWVGCTPPSSLLELQRQVEEQVADAGFPRETRLFHPHLTLGRLRRGAESSKLSGLGGMLDRLSYSEKIAVQSIELMQSEL